MIYGLIVILVAAILVYALISAPKQGPRARGQRGHVDRAMVASRWASIMLTADTGASGLKSAVSEADKLFDYVMRESGYPGETMAERLKRAQVKLSNRDGVWRAHKLRNALAHEVGFDLVVSQAREALRDFERGLRDLGAL